MEARPGVIAIVGPTASGKTALALDLAERYNGEIICADSRTIYRGMDIGTAKPTATEQSRTQHWGLDLVDPNQRFTAADFQTYANKKIADIYSRGKLVILVGGTGLYTDSVLYDYIFPSPMSEKDRLMLESKTVDELHKYCIEHNIELPINDKNKRHLVQRAIRGDSTQQRQSSLRSDTKIVGMATDKMTLGERITKRSEYMFDNGVVDEATLLGKKYGWDSEAMTGNVYRLIGRHQQDSLSRRDFVNKNTTYDRQLAKRQMTWFRRNPDIMWCSGDAASNYVRSLLTA